MKKRKAKLRKRAVKKLDKAFARKETVRKLREDVRDAERERKKRASLKKIEEIKTRMVKRKKSADPMQAFCERWRNGEQMAVLAAESGFKRSKFRRLMIAACGGKAEFAKLRSEGAGGRATPGDNLRRREKGQPLISDKDVKRVRSSPRWTLEREWRPTLVTMKIDGEKKTMPWRECKTTVFVSPSGNRYVRAQANERADLIMTFKGNAIPVARLRKAGTSALERKLKEEDRLVKRGLKKLAVVKKDKREKRQSRKRRKSK